MIQVLVSSLFLCLLSYYAIGVETGAGGGNGNSNKKCSGSFKDSKRLNELRKQIDHSDIEVRRRAAIALAAEGDVPGLMRLANDDAYQVREAVATWLIRNDAIERKDSIAIVEELSKQPFQTSSEVGSIMQIANRIGGDEAVRVLKTLSNNNNDYNRVLIARGKIGGDLFLTPNLHRRALRDIVDREDFKRIDLSIQEEVVKSAERLKDKELLRDVASKTKDPLIEGYARANMSTRASSVSTSFEEIIVSYAKSPDKQRRMAVINYMTDSGTYHWRSSNLFTEIARELLKDTDPFVRRRLIHRIIQAGVEMGIKYYEILLAMRSLLPEDRKYAIQQIDKTFPYFPSRKGLEGLKGDLLILGDVPNLYLL